MNQKIHELLGNLGLLRYTNCVERGCKKYHGRSPSQAVIFACKHISDAMALGLGVSSDDK